MPLWKCPPCGSFNSEKREVCRNCGVVRHIPTEEERQVFTSIVLPAALAERTAIKAELDATVAEEKRLRKQLKELERGR